MFQAKTKTWKLLLIFFLLIFTTSVVFAASKEIRDKIVEITKNQLNKPYGWGAAGPDKFDCSGLVNYSYYNAGLPKFMPNPHGPTALEQANKSEPILINQKSKESFPRHLMKQ